MLIIARSNTISRSFAISRSMVAEMRIAVVLVVGHSIPTLLFQANLFSNKPVDVLGAHNLWGTEKTSNVTW